MSRYKHEIAIGDYARILKAALESVLAEPAGSGISPEASDLEVDKWQRERERRIEEIQAFRRELDWIIPDARLRVLHDRAVRCLGAYVEHVEMATNWAVVAARVQPHQREELTSWTSRLEAVVHDAREDAADALGRLRVEHPRLFRRMRLAEWASWLIDEHEGRDGEELRVLPGYTLSYRP